MQCPTCRGTGRTPMVTIVKTDSGLPCDFPCIECDGTGEVEMTNEYFLRTATTEQLADVFFEYRYVNATPRQKLWMSASEKCIKTDIVEWLKQPHQKE